jgi:hypothetical protein
MSGAGEADRLAHPGASQPSPAGVAERPAPDPNPAAVPLEGDEPAAATPPSRGGDALADTPDNEPVGPAPALGGSPATSGPTPPVEEASTVVAWCLANDVNLGMARFQLARGYKDHFGPRSPNPLRTTNDLAALRGEAADRALTYLKAEHDTGEGGT